MCVREWTKRDAEHARPRVRPAHLHRDPSVSKDRDRGGRGARPRGWPLLVVPAGTDLRSKRESPGPPRGVAEFEFVSGAPAAEPGYGAPDHPVAADRRP